MLSLNLSCFVLLFAGIVVEAEHIKRQYRFPTHRNQCRPRLTSSTAQTSSAVLLAHTPSSSALSELSDGNHSHTKPIIKSTATSASTTSAFTTTKAIPTAQAAQPLVSSFVPNNIKAGIAGGDAYPFLKDHIGWWYDWSPNPSKPGKPVAVPMLWGGGTADSQDAQRLKAFEQRTTVPPYVLGYEEPDCPSGSGSAGMTLEDGVKKWESLIAPLGKKGAKLGSPSMCKQADETWLAQFKDKISTQWDFTAIHINKNNLDGVKKDIKHYMSYDKPIWVTEFACVDDVDGFAPCTDQQQINDFIEAIVPYLEENDNVYGYAYSNGEGLGDVWPLMDGDSLSESGQTYLKAISKYH